MRKLGRHLTYANVMSTIAVFLLLGGATAFAASRIGTDQLKAGAVTTGKLAKEAVKNGKIANDTVTGKKVKESSLGQVPSAEEASTLGGVTSSAFTRVASSSHQSIVLKGEDGIAETVSITVPHSGYLFIVGSGNVTNGGPTMTYSSCNLKVDGIEVQHSPRDIFTSEVVPKAECVTNAVAPVSAGTHTINLGFGTIGPSLEVENVGLGVAFIQLR